VASTRLPSHFSNFPREDDVVPVVLERRGNDGEADLALLREVEEIVARDRALDGRALRLEIGRSFFQRPGIQARTGDPVAPISEAFSSTAIENLAERFACPAPASSCDVRGAGES